MKPRRVIALVLSGVLAGLNVAVLAGTPGEYPANAGAAANWANHGGGVDESGYSRLEAINSRNIESLGLAWSMDLPGEVTLEATPLAVDGALYFSGSYSGVYAVDGSSGKLLWKYDPEIWRVAPAKQGQGMPVHRGVAYDNGRVFIGTLDGRLVALDAKTGKPQWTVDTLPANTFHSITGAPRTFNGKVIIGNGGADAAQRGFVTAYEQSTGKQLWRFHTTPGKPEDNAGDAAMEMAAKTWGGEYWKVGGGGGTVWNGITFDPELNRIYLGTGNGGPYNPRVRSPGGGDNLFRQICLALPGQSRRILGLQGHRQHDHRHGDDRRAPAQGTDAGAHQRLFLCDRSRDGQADLGGKDRQGHLGRAHRPRDGPPRRGAGHPL